jgi:hypothetical protein
LAEYRLLNEEWGVAKILMFYDRHKQECVQEFAGKGVFNWDASCDGIELCRISIDSIVAF